MKYYEYAYNNNKIEFYNSVLGKETVKLNDKIISEKFSINGASHLFKIDSNDILLKTDYKLFKDRKFDLILFDNGEVLDSKRIKLDKKQRIFWMGLGILIGLGIFELLKMI